MNNKCDFLSENEVLNIKAFLNENISNFTSTQKINNKYSDEIIWVDFSSFKTDINISDINKKYSDQVMEIISQTYNLSDESYIIIPKNNKFYILKIKQDEEETRRFEWLNQEDLDNVIRILVNDSEFIKKLENRIVSTINSILELERDHLNEFFSKWYKDILIWIMKDEIIENSHIHINDKNLSWIIKKYYRDHFDEINETLFMVIWSNLTKEMNWIILNNMIDWFVSKNRLDLNENYWLWKKIANSLFDSYLMVILNNKWKIEKSDILYEIFFEEWFYEYRIQFENILKNKWLKVDNWFLYTLIYKNMFSKKENWLLYSLSERFINFLWNIWDFIDIKKSNH